MTSDSRLLQISRRRSAILGGALCLALLATAVFFAGRAQANNFAGGFLHREGSRLKLSGKFQPGTGQRWIFLVSAKEGERKETSRFTLLENQALERVAKDPAAAKTDWLVEGMVTEYRGENYLMLDSTRKVGSAGP